MNKLPPHLQEIVDRIKSNPLYTVEEIDCDTIFAMQEQNKKEKKS